MPSIRARLLNRYLRLVMKPMRLHEMDPETLRAWMEKRVLPVRLGDVALDPVEKGSVRGEWQRPNDPEPGTILYLHGGGYVFCSVRTHRPLTTALARASRRALFSLDYRLAPEHPCPAAIEDAVAAFDWLVGEGRDPAAIVVAGDSAGGGLALAVMLALKARGGPLPAGAVLYSPWTDLAATSESVNRNARADAMFQRDSIIEGAARYAGALDRKDPRVSPLYADLSGLPPLLVFASTTEMLFDDSARLAEKAKAAGVDVDFRPREGLAHVWPLFYPLIPEAKASVRESAEFIVRRLAAAASP
ncbi:alpha/beta hydrolase [Amphiplicatus metriothermophilus]|uniref:Acetyl esterase/lipase n=1 Tax=Amphiplicatus metriothermophilus TaxID=1519374 RepID=A0A239Q100_9PROT|nr:alpha/beta hydrolase [Amphiplicatus metriothermophilus]MBB5520183.1 acetyl esterase/lipase [Amphiplicatus metriothermophilus]SNT75906.1 Acetyl esterase/lipase [Amphiplicatus metriothermophilus]